MRTAFFTAPVIRLVKNVLWYVKHCEIICDVAYKLQRFRFTPRGPKVNVAFAWNFKGQCLFHDP